MENRGNILICDKDEQEVQRIRAVLASKGYGVQVVADAAALVQQVERSKPGLVLVNPDQQDINEYDICTRVMQKASVPVVLMLDKNSAHTAMLGDCRVEVVVTKPVDTENLLLMIANQVVLSSQGPQ